jgi:hypothetical protein
MKNLWIMISLLALALFAGCAPAEEGEENEGEGTDVAAQEEDGITGTWRMQLNEAQVAEIEGQYGDQEALDQQIAMLEGAIEATEDEAQRAEMQTMLDNLPRTTDEAIAMAEEAVTIEFNEDGTYVRSVSLMGMSETETGTYELDGDTLTTTPDNAEQYDAQTITFNEDDQTMSLTVPDTGEITLVRN